MNARAKREAGSKLRFQPRLESLEDRWCPAVTMSVRDGHILEVIGDRGNNVIEIQSQGSLVSVLEDGGPAQTFTGIDTIRANTWAGDDLVRMVFEPSDHSPRELQVSVDLGAGNDAFTLLCPTDPMTPPPDPDIQPRIDVAVVGGTGDDTFRTFLGSSVDPESIPSPSCIEAELHFDFEGDGGADRFVTDVDNVGLDGRVDMHMDGGAGDDMFQTTLGHVDINAPMSLNEMGGAGRDDIRVICGFNPQPDPPVMPLVSINAPVNVMLDGGRGDDNIAVICGFNPQPDPPAFPAFAVMSRFELGVLGGEGDDMIDARIAQPTFVGSATFSAGVQGGAGNDFVNVAIVDPVGDHYGDGRAHLDLSVAGGDGQDQIHVLAGQLNNAPDPDIRLDWNIAVTGDNGNDSLTCILLPAVQRGGSFMASFDGGAGNDMLLGDMLPGPCEPGSAIDVSFMGGNGNDLVVVQVDLSRFTNESGQLHVAVNGGEGADHMVLLAHGADRPMENALFALDGGAGEDSAVVSPTVHVRNVEHVEFM